MLETADDSAVSLRTPPWPLPARIEWLTRRGTLPPTARIPAPRLPEQTVAETVTNPVAVDPDEELRRIAETRGWPIVSLRNDGDRCH